ncbi:MAG: T9SS type A sorting domain-containing protein [Bacteroidota bacterium]
MGPRQYVIFEDVVLHLGGEVQLPGFGTEEIRVPATGATYHMEVQQAVGHPVSDLVSATVEACGNFPPEDFSLGFFGQYPRDDGNPFRSTDCFEVFPPDRDGLSGPGGVNKRENTEAVSLRVSPRGYGPRGEIDISTRLTYHLSLRNPLADTLRRVVFLDTLPVGLDLTSIEGGMATDPYAFTVSPLGVIEITFDDLTLAPGATVGVRFTVGCQEGIMPGAVLRNRIYAGFGGRELLASDPVTVTVRKPLRYGTDESRNCFPAAPNLPALVRRLDTLRTMTYDSITLSLDYLLPAYAITLDTVIRKGDTLWGMEILADTEFTRELTTSAGCDSLLIVRVTADLTSTPTVSPEEIGLYPNPATDYAILRLPREAATYSIRLTDLLGRTFQVVEGQQRGDGILIDLGKLPAGTYVVEASTPGQRPWRGKLIKR